MKHSIAAILSLALSSGAGLAQSPTITILTRGDYGVIAGTDKGHEVDGLADATAISGTTHLHARIPGASAHDIVHPSRGRHGQGVTVHEWGHVLSRSGEGETFAATVDEAGHHDHSAPHTLTLIVEGATATEGTVTVAWGAWASDHSEASCSIDLDDDTVPDFTAEANTPSIVREFRVQRLGRRFLVHLTLHAEAEVEGRGAAAYAAGLGVWFREGAPSAAATPYGGECGGRLEGSVADRVASIRLAAAATDGFGLFLIGDQPAGISLGTCTLLTQPVLAVPFRTDAQGAVIQELRLPARGEVDVRVQGLVVTAGIAASNGLRIEAR